MKVRRHLRHIASKYRKVREVWNAKVEQFEKEQIEKNPQAAGSILERMAAASAAASAVGGQRRSSYRDRSSGAAGTGSSILMGGANFIRSDYEQEQLLKEVRELVSYLYRSLARSLARWGAKERKTAFPLLSVELYACFTSCALL